MQISKVVSVRLPCTGKLASLACIHCHVAVSVCMFGLLNCLLGILGHALEAALENTLLGIERSSYVMCLTDSDLQVSMQEDHGVIGESSAEC